MKIKYTFYILFFSLFLFSCSQSEQSVEDEGTMLKAEDLDDLLFKYKEIKATECEDLFAIGDEMYDVYINTIDEAVKGTDKAISDLLSFHLFMDRFDKKMLQVSEKCPEEFFEWSEKIEKRMEGPNYKLIEIFKTDYNPIELDKTVIDELDKQLEELQLELDRIFNEDSINVINEDSINVEILKKES